MIGATLHFLKLSLAYAARPRAPRKVATLWAYLKIVLIQQLNLRRSTVRMLGWTVSFPSAFGLRALFEEIFLGEHYRLRELGTSRPLIIDAGANIGVASLYFKGQYPDARIICCEPDPAAIAHLKRNVDANDLVDVTVHAVALGAEPGRATLYRVDESAFSSLVGDWVTEWRQATSTGAEPAPGEVGIDVRPLSQLLEREDEVDALKLDIEGSEGIVLEEIDARLANVGQLLVEYHRWPGSTPLSAILAALERNRHTYEVTNWATMGAMSTCVVRSWLLDEGGQHTPYA